MKIAVCEVGSCSAFDLIHATRELGYGVLVVDESDVGALDALAI